MARRMSPAVILIDEPGLLGLLRAFRTGAVSAFATQVDATGS